MIPTKFGLAFTAKFMNQAGALVHVYTVRLALCLPVIYNCTSTRTCVSTCACSSEALITRRTGQCW
jgi:hypothetical protein